MRRNLGYVLLALSGLLLTLAVLAVAWAPGAIKKTPLDVSTRTLYEGEAAKINTSTNEFISQPVYAVQETKADSENSSDDHVLFVETSCLVVDTGGDRVCVDGDDPNLITADIDIFATDRITALGVEDPNLPPETVLHEGLVNKFPFDVEQEDYPYWDGLIGRPVDMVYEDTETIEGLETYRFVATVEDEPVEVAEGVPGTYSNVVTVNVDPATGSIVKGAQDQQRFLDDGTQVLDVDITWTAETIQNAVDEAKTNGQSLNLLLKIVPIVGFVVGGLALIGGLFVAPEVQTRRSTVLGSGQPPGREGLAGPTARRPHGSRRASHRSRSMPCRSAALRIAGERRVTLGRDASTGKQPGAEDRRTGCVAAADAGPAAPDAVVPRRPLGLEQGVDDEAVAREQADPVAERAVVLDVRHVAGLVVDLDVGPAVPVALAGQQPGLAGVVGEHPPGRMGDGEGEPATRPQHPRRFGDGVGDIGDELERPEGTEDDVERRRGERQLGGRAKHGRHHDPGGVVDPTGVLELAHREVQTHRSAALGAHPARALTGARADFQDVEPGDVAEDAQVGLGVALGTPHEPDVAQELAVRGLVLVRVPIPVGTVGPSRLGLGDRAAIDAYAGVDGAGHRLLGHLCRFLGGHQASVRRLDRRSVTRVCSMIAPGVCRFPDRAEHGSLSRLPRPYSSVEPS